MQSQERDLIEGLFNRLKAYEAQPRDPEAERLIASLIARQPGAPYLLTQTVLVQEHALKAAQERIAELEAKAKAAAAQPGFLESAPRIGPWGAAPSAAAAAAPATAAMRSPPPAAAAAQPSAGGGFLRSALATAAGVAGGALLFDGIRNLLANTGSPFGSVGYPEPPAAAAAANPLMPPDQISSADLAQDDGAADNYDASPDDSDGDGDDFGDDSAFDDSNEV
ncbi:DUF2076 family protein [Enhydrobacter sp.]|jgi:hypothetical protein|uniref:DUF2076 family protein n=1 Tax=Enhydrobacter sp. TaxID=1894999 RepID=UPI002607C23F|nr:DUF2076 family protein [Enhydrobacter sp.]WIM14119.1 MAG: hypothetical protein OJF58_005089 [Enhydrobacter sp.]